MAECLILGSRGIGKTSVVLELLSRGHLAHDADLVPGLGKWFDTDGQPCDYNCDPAWRDSHRFLWDMSVLGRLIERDRSQTLYVAGTAHNDLRATRLFFTHLVVLDANVDTYCQRRLSENRRTPYPADDIDEYRTSLVAVLPGLRVAWRALGATIIDTTELTIPQVADRIIARVEG